MPVAGASTGAMKQVGYIKASAGPDSLKSPVIAKYRLRQAKKALGCQKALLRDPSAKTLSSAGQKDKDAPQKKARLKGKQLMLKLTSTQISPTQMTEVMATQMSSTDDPTETHSQACAPSPLTLLQKHQTAGAATSLTSRTHLQSVAERFEMNQNQPSDAAKDTKNIKFLSKVEGALRSIKVKQVRKNAKTPVLNLLSQKQAGFATLNSAKGASTPLMQLTDRYSNSRQNAAQ